jgi:NAD(P)-dependent dehydrogenase (short-subunit alcohol dehydrogenase family)
LRLKDKVTVVTGAASGIGRATATLFAREGAMVVLADLRDAGDVARAIEAPGGRARSVRLDVSLAEEVECVMADTAAREGRVDVLVAAAGVGGGTGATADYPDEDFRHVVGVNLCGVFYSMKYAIRAMRGGGSIVTIASVMGVVGLPGTPAYSAAKGGVVQLTKVAALEYASAGIRVNCVCPGMIETPMIARTTPAARSGFVARQPLGRMGTADEVAEACLFLASDASSFTTGAVLPVDGGYLAH